MGTFALASFCIGGAIALYMLNKHGKLLTVCCAIGGYALYKLAGGTIKSLTGTTGVMLGGVSITAVLAGFALFWLCVEWKAGCKNKKTCVIALLAPTLFLISGVGVLSSVAQNGQNFIQKGGTTISQTTTGG